jgi:hypothetical protein
MSLKSLLGRSVSQNPNRRRGTADRRRTPRPDSTGRRATDVMRAGVFSAMCLTMFGSSPASAQTAAPAAASTIGFGFDASSAQRARNLGMPVAYGNVWAGAWNQPEKYGWGGIKTQLKAAQSAQVVPVIHWYYWGDDISPACVENGCHSTYHGGVDKNKATWYRMSRELAALTAEVFGRNSGAIVVLETEFNKKGIGRYEPFDGYLAEHAQIFHEQGLKVVIGFGNWDRHLWPNFDRAIAAADMLGVMALQSSVRDSSTYMSGAEMLLSAARYNQRTFGKPSFVSDFAFSSFPDESYELSQDAVIRDIFRRMDEFRAAGVRGFVWRMLFDDPKFSLANYHKEAERHWGLINADGTPKLAFQPFLNGMIEAQQRQTMTQEKAPAMPSVASTRVRGAAAPVHNGM